MKIPRQQAGFTLAEVAVTLVIVGVGLVYVLQGLNTAKITALHTYQKKVAREMAVLTLGQVESGLFWEEIIDTGDHLTGTYHDEGYEDYSWEVVFGATEEFAFRVDSDYEERDRYDAFADRRERELEEDRWGDNEDEEGDPAENPEPYEIVRIRITLETRDGRVRELMTLERYIPWVQVYGESEEDAEEGDGEDAGDEEPFE